MKKYVLSMLLGVFLILGLTSPVHAESKEVKADITKFSILNWKKAEANAIYETNTFYLSMDWDASAHGADLTEGDYFDIILPDQMVFPSDSAHTDFHLYANDGKSIIANAHVTPNQKSGGKVRVTFTDYVNEKYNVKGNIYLAAHFDTSHIKVGEDNTFEITVNGKVITKSVKVTGPTEIKNEVLCKWGTKDNNDPLKAVWAMRINHKKRTLENAVLTDTLGDSGESYIKDSFKLYEVEFNEKGSILSKKTVSIDGKLSFSEDGSSFTLQLGDVNQTSYYLTYKSTYTPSTLLQNKVKLTAGKDKWVQQAGYRSSDAGGNGDGDLTNKIKIIKVDADDGKTRLKDASFIIANKETGKKETVTTDEEGEAISHKLISGNYTIEETEAPIGYRKNETPITVHLNEGATVIKTITNESLKRSIKVTKKWIGEKQEAITIHLLADGKVINTAKLNDDNQWTYTFTDLPQYKEGQLINYTVEEEHVDGYTTEIKNNEDGFIITNTKNPESPQEEVTKEETTEEGHEGKTFNAPHHNQKKKNKVNSDVVETGDHTKVLTIEILFIASAILLLIMYRKIKG